MKGNPSYKMAKHLARCISDVMWIAKQRSDVSAYLAENSKVSVEDEFCFFLSIYSKLRDGRDKLRIELIKHKTSNS